MVLWRQGKLPAKDGTARRKAGEKKKVAQETEWPIESLEDKCTSTKKAEDTEESNSRRAFTYFETNSPRKEFCQEMDDEVWEKYGVDEGK